MNRGPVMVHDGIFIGNGYDADQHKFAGSVLHCAKDPWYVQAIYVPPIIPNVKRIKYNEMALNMIDAHLPKFFSDEMVNAGLEFITERLAEEPILVHCNMGLSRSPSMVFLWMFEHGFLDDEFRYAMPQFKELYPSYCPANGIWQYLKTRCK